MKTNKLFGLALFLMLMGSVAMAPVSAEDDKNPGQAGRSSIYSYEVAANDTHGAGRLIIDVSQQSYVFNGKGFEPSAQIELRAMSEGSGDYVVFGVGNVTPSGNLHISGPWTAATPPSEVVAGSYPAGAYAMINGFHLWNSGLFIAKHACYYSTDGGVTWKESSHTDGFKVNHGAFLELRDIGVPDYALVREHAIVVGGKDRTGSEIFQYDPYNCGKDFSRRYAGYVISGVTWNPTLQFDGFGDVMW